MTDLQLKQTQENLDKVEAFLETLNDIKSKLENKKEEARKTIKTRMKDLHQLVDKWETRFLDTVHETIDEKIENITKQEEILRSTVEWVKEQKKANRYSKIIPVEEDVKPKKIKELKKESDDESEESDEDEEDKRLEELSNSTGGEDDEDDDELQEEEIAKHFMSIWNGIKFPLTPTGVSMEEANADVKNEFGQLLDESRKSLKRSLLFVGGIVRAYMRRGHKKDDWVNMVRRLEARSEANPNVDLTLDSGITQNNQKYLSGDTNAFNFVWKAMSDVFLHKNNPSFKESLTNQMNYLYAIYPSHVEFYLPQLINLFLCNKDFPLGDFIISKCKEETHFAIATYFLVTSMSQVGSSKWKKRCLKILKKVIHAIPVAKMTVSLTQIMKRRNYSNSNTPTKSLPSNPSESTTHLDVQSNAPTAETLSISPQNLLESFSPLENSFDLNGDSKSEELKGYNSDDPEEEIKKLTQITRSPPPPRGVDKNIEVPEGKEYFFAQIKFIRKLVDVSRKLGELYGKPTLYKKSLDKRLTSLEPFVLSGYGYIPNNSGSRSRVLKILIPESSPIPTYGRVLYRMIVEVINVPKNYTKEMVDEYIQLSSDIEKMNAWPKFGEIERSNSGNQQQDELSDREEHSHHEEEENEEASSFGENWRSVRRRIKSQSPFGSLPHWGCRAFIVKHGDQVLQEQFVMQLVMQFQRIWDIEGLPLKLHCYNILAQSYQSGLIEVVPNSISLDKLKKSNEETGSACSLMDFFKRQWKTNEAFKRARSNFVSSLAAYSIVCYLLQIKDRHNGNIMIDSEGHIFHIDFGYLLSRTIKFEKAPFKLTDEFVEVMGGDSSKSFKEYCDLCVRGYNAARKHYEKILMLVEMTLSEGGSIPCLEMDDIGTHLRKRYHLEWDENQCEEYIMNLICEARDNWRTQLYDTYQRIVNDIH